MLKHVEGIGLINLSAVTFIDEAPINELEYFGIIVNANQKAFRGIEAYTNLVKAIEEADIGITEDERVEWAKSAGQMIAYKGLKALDEITALCQQLGMDKDVPGGER